MMEPWKLRALDDDQLRTKLRTQAWYMAHLVLMYGPRMDQPETVRQMVVEIYRRYPAWRDDLPPATRVLLGMIAE